MTLLKREIKANLVTLCIWCGVLCAMNALTMLLFPSFRDQMGNFSAMFSMLGPFTAALGLDVLDFGTAIGFYGTESGTMMAVGGTMFAAYVGVSLLAKEEGWHTAEFLLTQPISRARVVLEKLLALLALLLLFNAVAAGIGALCFVAIGEPIPMRIFLLFHLAQFLLQVEIGCICLAISAASRRPMIGMALGIALLLYFLSLIVNMVDAAAFLRFVTPFSYAEPSRVFPANALDGTLLAIGGAVTGISIGAAFVAYQKKDIAA